MEDIKGKLNINTLRMSINTEIYVKIIQIYISVDSLSLFIVHI